MSEVLAQLEKKGLFGGIPIELKAGEYFDFKNGNISNYPFTSPNSIGHIIIACTKNATQFKVTSPNIWVTAVGVKSDGTITVLQSDAYMANLTLNVTDYDYVMFTGLGQATFSITLNVT